MLGFYVVSDLREMILLGLWLELQIGDFGSLNGHIQCFLVFVCFNLNSGSDMFYQIKQ